MAERLAGRRSPPASSCRSLLWARPERLVVVAKLRQRATPGRQASLRGESEGERAAMPAPLLGRKSLGAQSASGRLGSEEASPASTAGRPLAARLVAVWRLPPAPPSFGSLRGPGSWKGQSLAVLSGRRNPLHTSREEERLLMGSSGAGL